MNQTMAGSRVRMAFVHHDERWQVAWPSFEEDTARLGRCLETVVPSSHQLFTATVLLTDDAEQQSLNHQFRGIDRATNVLSFPADIVDREGPEDALILGDISLAYETVAREAADGGLSIAAHGAHMIVHGFFHLLGYDHQTDSDADDMETRETQVLIAAGFADPYAADLADTTSSNSI